jgi:hypothetical protein
MGRACSTNRGPPGMNIGVWLESQKRPLGRPERRWEDNIKMDLRWDDVVWTRLIWLRIRTSGGLL